MARGGHCGALCWIAALLLSGAAWVSFAPSVFASVRTRPRSTDSHLGGLRGAASATDLTPEGASSAEPTPSSGALRGGLATLAASLAAVVVLLGGVAVGGQPAAANDVLSTSKIMKGGASSGTKDALGSKKIMTRGIILNNADFSDQNVPGVSFQQSIVRYANFKNATLTGASFFDADMTGCDFTGAIMTQANLELGQFTKAILNNVVATEMYVGGTTRLDVASIDGADFTDTPMRKDQQNYLCKIAKGTNPVTKVDTRESLQCPE